MKQAEAPKRTVIFDMPRFGETFHGEPITGLVEMNGKIILMTPNKTYSIKQMRWYERLWARIRGVNHG